MRMTSHGWAVLLGVVAAIGLAVTTVRAHEMTHRGVVRAVEADRVQVQTLADDGTEAEVVWFTVTAETEVRRGDTVVTFAAAEVRDGERIVVIVDHDVDETAALDIRLAAR